MRASVVLAERPEFTVTAVTCRDDHTGWSDAEPRDDFGFVLVRRGRFRRRVAGRPADLDPTLAYLARPGDEEHFAHPCGGDVCTALSITPAFWRTLTGDLPGGTTSTVYVDAQLELAHRRVLSAARGGDVDYAVAEQFVGLIGAAVTRTTDRPPPTSTPDSAVAGAREAIAADHPAATGLLPLAALLGVSPFRLSRAFTRELGVSLTRYRNRVRVARALDRLEGGETQLAILAADLGFADQAHLTRTMREHLGHTPTALRALLSRADCAAQGVSHPS